MIVGIVGILNKTGDEARILERRGKTNGKENFVDFLVSMSRAVAKAVKGPEKKPIFFWFSLWIIQGRSNDGYPPEKMHFCNCLGRGGDAF
jgi:hypothetical protein